MPVVQPSTAVAPPGTGPRLVATAQPGGRCPRVLLQVADAGVSSVTITRRDPDGRTRSVRTGAPLELAAGGHGIAYDYEMVYAPVSYQISALGLRSQTVVVEPRRPYLIDPGSPGTAMRLEVANLGRGTLGERTRAGSASYLDVLNAAEPVVQVQGRRRAASSRLLVRTRDRAEAAALEGLLGTGQPLLLNVPPELGWGITQEWLSVDEVTETRTGAQLLQDPERLWTLPYRVVRPPVGPLRPERTYGVVGAQFATYGDAAAAFETYGAAARDEQVLLAP